MKSIGYIFTINILNILIMIVINLLFLYIVNPADYGIYSRYLWLTSYCGIFNLGIVASIQKKFRNTSLEEYNLSTLAYHFLIIIFCVGTSTYIAKNIINIPGNIIFLIATISNLYYYCVIYLQIFKKLVLYNIMLVLEKLCFVISIIVLIQFQDIGVRLIKLDLLLKSICILLPIIITISNGKVGKIIKFSKKEIILGANIMLGNWLLIYILKSDMILVDKSSALMFEQYAMAISFTTMIALVLQPIKYILYNVEQTSENVKEYNEKIYYTTFFFTIIVYFILNVFIKIDVFPHYKVALEISRYMIFISPLYVVTTTNLTNIMQINKSKKYVIVLIVITIVLSLILTIMNIDSYLQIIIFKMLLLTIIYAVFSFISLNTINVKFVVLLMVALLCVYVSNLFLIVVGVWLMYKMFKITKR